MRRCLWRLCAHRGAADKLHRLPVPPPLSALPTSIAVTARDTTAAAQLYRQCMNPQLPPSDVVQVSTDLLPFMTDNQLDLHQRMEVLTVLAARSIRNENVILRCLWDVFKAPLPADDNTNAILTSRSLLLSQLAAYTSRAFRVMAEQRFLNDPQMTAVALGRCVELAGHLNLESVSDIYRGLREVNHTFFSAAEAALYGSEVTAQMTTKEFYEMESPVEADALRHQPNLIDVLCGELEMQLQRFATAHTSASTALLESGYAAEPLISAGQKDRTSLHTHVTTTPPPLDLSEPQHFLTILQSLAVTGVLHASTLECLTSLVPRYRTAASCGFFIHALDAATKIAERVVDPLYYEENAEVQDARWHLTWRLSEEMQRMRGVASHLRHHPQELLLLRRVFEREANASLLSPALWDTVRTIRVAHRHAVAETQPSKRPEGKLFHKKYDVKVNPITVDDADAERFVPSEFKTWRTPVAHPRGGHPRNGKRRPLRKMAFGTRRISRNYIQNKRKKYCPAVF